MPDEIKVAELVHRDRSRLNERYIRRGEVGGDLSRIGSWNDDLEAMNDGKRGGPYRFPRSLVRFISFLWDVRYLALRQAEGYLRALRQALDIEVPDYTTLW